MESKKIFSVACYDPLFHAYVTYDSWLHPDEESAIAKAKELVSKRISVSATVGVSEDGKYFTNLHTFGRKNPMVRKSK